MTNFNAKTSNKSNNTKTKLQWQRSASFNTPAKTKHYSSANPSDSSDDATRSSSFLGSAKKHLNLTSNFNGSACKQKPGGAQRFASVRKRINSLSSSIASQVRYSNINNKGNSNQRDSAYKHQRQPNFSKLFSAFLGKLLIAVLILSSSCFIQSNNTAPVWILPSSDAPTSGYYELSAFPKQSLETDSNSSGLSLGEAKNNNPPMDQDNTYDDDDNDSINAEARSTIEGYNKNHNDGGFWIERRRMDRERNHEPAPWLRQQPMRRRSYGEFGNMQDNDKIEIVTSFKEPENNKQVANRDEGNYDSQNSDLNIDSDAATRSNQNEKSKKLIRNNIESGNRSQRKSRQLETNIQDQLRKLYSLALYIRMWHSIIYIYLILD